MPAVGTMLLLGSAQTVYKKMRTIYGLGDGIKIGRRKSAKKCSVERIRQSCNSNDDIHRLRLCHQPHH